MLYWWYLTNAEVPLMKFELQADDKAVLEKLVKSGMTPVIISQRAQILLKKAENKSSTKVAEELNVNRHIWNQIPEDLCSYSRQSMRLG